MYICDTERDLNTKLLQGILILLNESWFGLAK